MWNQGNAAPSNYLAIDDNSYRNNLRGVTFEQRTSRWRARLYVAGKHVTLGRLHTCTQAAQLHDAAAYYVLGEQAVTNYGIEAAQRELRKIVAAEAAGKKRAGFCIARLKDVRARVELLQREQMMQTSPQRGPQLFSTRSAGNEMDRARRMSAAAMAVAGGARVLDNMSPCPTSTVMTAMMMMRRGASTDRPSFSWIGREDGQGISDSGRSVAGTRLLVGKDKGRRSSHDLNISKNLTQALVMTACRLAE